MATKLPTRLPADVTETQFGKYIEACARAHGWLCCHVRPLKVRANGNKWITPTTMKGFPDYVLVHPGLSTMFYIEIKARGGKCTPEQKRWLQALGRIEGVSTYAAWPEDWPAIRELLERGSVPATDPPVL